MDTQQMMELLLAMREDMKASNDNTKAMNKKMNKIKEDRKLDREVVRAGQEQLQENLMRMMEEMMNTNQAKTDVKIEELSGAIEETRVEREKPTSADMNACQDAMEANLVKMEPNRGLKEAAVEQQETPNEDVAIYSLRNC
jgi:hypothetical protein